MIPSVSGILASQRNEIRSVVGQDRSLLLDRPSKERRIRGTAHSERTYGDDVVSMGLEDFGQERANVLIQEQPDGGQVAAPPLP